MIKHDLLIEIGTEELPPKSLSSLSTAFEQLISQNLLSAKLEYETIESFATPRRLAIIVRSLHVKQADTMIEKFGPAFKVAFDENDIPTKAAQGFARSCGVSVSDLQQKIDGKVTKLFYSTHQKGKETKTLIPDIVNSALAALPIPKRMRWGSSRIEFIRPVHWTILLFGSEVIPATILGVETQNITFGHRFHHPEPIHLNDVSKYITMLNQPGFVIASFESRKETILQLIKAEGEKLNATPIIDQDLLNEVTALVEWPVALTGSFDQEYLSVPQEALISSMKGHQKYFYLVDTNNSILPNFITISNLQSKSPELVIKGNEKVIGPRLKDASFFYEQDKKYSLESLRKKLTTVIFQQQLGTVFEKTERVATLSHYIATCLDFDAVVCERSAKLAKSDLLTSMVGEFPDLQGVMGFYYALNDNETQEVAIGIREQYLPRFAGDKLPDTNAGIVLALAERIDTLTGLFGIGQPPTGSKDPFALRRAALGVLRIIIEKRLNIDLKLLISQAIRGFDKLPEQNGVESTLLDFIFDRLRAWYVDLGISSEVFLAVDSIRPTSPYDFDLRINAVNSFIQLPESKELASANKRVANILSKQNHSTIPAINHALLVEPAEISLANTLESIISQIQPLLAKHEYSKALALMASLHSKVFQFFDTVMVNTEDEEIKNNRLALLQSLRRSFLEIADISLL